MTSLLADLQLPSSELNLRTFELPGILKIAFFSFD